MAYDANSFFDMAPAEKRGLGRYIGGAALTIVLWFVLIVIMTVALMAAGFGDAINMTQEKPVYSDLPPEQDFNTLVIAIFLLASFIALLVANIFVIKVVHGQPLREVITAREKFDFRRFWLSGLVILGLHMLLLAFGLLSAPEDFEVIFDPVRMAPFVVLVILLVPLQAFSEELFFRGYLAQGIAAQTGSLVVRLAVPAFIFTIFHAANGDWAAGGIWAVLTYFTLALYLGYLTWQSNGLEVATGLHVLHNMIAFIVVTSKTSGMPFLTILVTDDPDYMAGYLSLIPVLAIHYFVVRRMGLLQR